MALDRPDKSSVGERDKLHLQPLELSLTALTYFLKLFAYKVSIICTWTVTQWEGRFTINSIIQSGQTLSYLGFSLPLVSQLTDFNQTNTKVCGNVAISDQTEAIHYTEERVDMLFTAQYLMEWLVLIAVLSNSLVYSYGYSRHGLFSLEM